MRAYHGEVDVFDVLEGVEELDKPRGLDGRQDISLDQHMLDFVHFGQSTLAHLFQSAHFARVDLARKVDRAVPSLADLRDDAELVDAELGSPFSKQDALSAIVRLELARVLGAGYLPRSLAPGHDLATTSRVLKGSRFFRSCRP